MILGAIPQSDRSARRGSGDRPFVTAWIDEDEQETVTFAEFRRRARLQAAVLRDHGVTAGDRVIIIMPQGIAAMTTFVGAMMLGAVPAFLAYPNFKVEPSKYRSGLAGVTANLKAKVVVIDDEFPDEMLGHVRSAREQGCFAPATAATRAKNEISRFRTFMPRAWRSSSIRPARPDCRKESR